jgi:hypothetical protein
MSKRYWKQQSYNSRRSTHEDLVNITTCRHGNNPRTGQNERYSSDGHFYTSQGIEEEHESRNKEEGYNNRYQNKGDKYLNARIDVVSLVVVFCFISRRFSLQPALSDVSNALRTTCLLYHREERYLP